MALAGMTQEQTNKENRDHCKRIVENLELYASGCAYKCPECGEVYEIDEDHGFTQINNGTHYKCPCCKEEIFESDLEAVGIWDYMSDVLDVEFSVSNKKEYRSVRIMVACGGPNIFIDTASKEVELYWWTDSASYPLSSDAVDAIDEWAEEYWMCL